MPEPYRAAVYYAPEREDPLWELGCAWLGRDPETGFDVQQPDVPEIAARTSDPARYGFHATLKPPMALTRGYAAFLADLARLSHGWEAFEMPKLEVRQLGRFTALCVAEPSLALDALAASCVTELDAHRAPEDVAMRAKRAAGRSESQLRNLERYGYPLVLDDWRFHMTLSNADSNASLAAPAMAFFDGVLTAPRWVRSIAVFVEPKPGEPFRLTARLPIGRT